MSERCSKEGSDSWRFWWEETWFCLWVVGVITVLMSSMPRARVLDAYSILTKLTIKSAIALQVFLLIVLDVSRITTCLMSIQTATESDIF
jgi:hypothetical protein